MKHHWIILLWMLAGILVGGLFQQVLDAPAWAGLSVKPSELQVGVRVTEAKGPSKRDARNPRVGLAKGDFLDAVTLYKGRKDKEKRHPLRSQADLDKAIANSKPGDILWFAVGEQDKRHVPITLKMKSGSQRAQWLAVPVMVMSPTRSMSRSEIVPMEPLTTMSPTAAPLKSDVMMSDDFELVP